MGKVEVSELEWRASRRKPDGFGSQTDKNRRAYASTLANLTQEI